MKRLPPKPKAPEDGMFIMDHESGQEVFMTFEELHETCNQMMHPVYSDLVASEFGKIDYRQDPTYNMKRKRK